MALTIKKVQTGNRKRILLSAILLLIATYAFLNVDINPVNKTNSNGSKTFNSNNLLKFSIEVPNIYHIYDNSENILINSNLGEITIIRNGTNFNNLSDYLSNFDNSRKNFEINTENFLSINGLEAMTRTVSYPDQQYTEKVYFIYVNHFVYSISTSSKKLFNDLDQIAKSFKYIGK